MELRAASRLVALLGSAAKVQADLARERRVAVWQQTEWQAGWWQQGALRHGLLLCDERPHVTLSRSFIADAAASASPAVVNIVATHGTFGMSASAGSGFVIDKNGLLMTNAHVVEKAHNGEVTVTLWNGRKLRGKVHSMDKESDIALVQIVDPPPPGGFSAAHIGTSSRLRAGDFVVALGSPLNLGRTVTAGIVSTTARHASEIGTLSSKLDYIQTDAAVNQGNSGGPLVNLDGEVIGVCTLKAGNSDGIAFAVPIDTAWPVVKKLLKYRKVVRPYVGIKFQTDHSAKAVMVADVRVGSPAEIAGVSVGDRIVSVDGHPVNRIRDILNRTGVSPGQQMKVEIETPEGETQTVTIVTAAEKSSGK